MHTIKRTSLSFALILVTVLVLALTLTATQAGDTTLTNNAGTGSSPWVITGESSLVINGFDLNARGIALPTTLDRVSIDIAVAVPGETVSAVVYQDANGGSPADATLVRQETVTINTTGVFTYTFATPVQITQPVIWVGFYLPVGFEFNADTSGASLLTYWAWEPGSTFALNQLSSADVLGPSDGSAPVNLNIGGVARITAELITGTTPTPPTTPGAATPTPSTPGQITGPEGVSLRPLVNYGDCGLLYYDSDDLRFTYQSSVRFFCKFYPEQLAPANPEGFALGGPLYDITAFGDVVSPGTNPLPNPVTHCIAPPAEDINRAVIGLAYGAPRAWEILPTVRFGDVICAEVFYTGYISYFLPN